MLDWEEEEDPRTGILYRPAQNPLYMFSMALIGVLDSLVIFLTLGLLCSSFQLRFIFWHLNRQAKKAQQLEYYGSSWRAFRARWSKRWYRKIKPALEQALEIFIVLWVLGLAGFFERDRVGLARSPRRRTRRSPPPPGDSQHRCC